MKKKRAKTSPAASGAAGVPKLQKAKGAAQMAVGAALAVAGVPMCILPGPGVAAIAGGAALASRGQRNFTGRAPSKVEQRLDAAASKMGEAVKEQAAKAARAAAREAPVVARKAFGAAAHVIGAVAQAAARRVRKS